ncbi:MAG: hypothetical protein ACO3K3_05295 [Schleiferiaceae bacterium]
MSYQVLARKWRPKQFMQVVGQEHVLASLMHALNAQRVHHAYLFTGTRGVGKTTIARILAKSLSCEQGVISVVHGVAVGALATALAAGGLSLAGVGGTATIPASVPLYATAGGLIAFGLSGETWTNCLFGLARLGFALMQNGYWSAARGIQNIVRSNRSGGAFARPSAPATTSTSTATAE